MGAFKAQTVVTAAAGRCVRCPLTAFYCFFRPQLIYTAVYGQDGVGWVFIYTLWHFHG
jgi:hypothetical protein